MRKLFMEQPTRILHDYQQLRWNGPYEILKIEQEYCYFILAKHIRFKLQASNLVVEQFHTQSFLVTFEKLISLVIENEP